MLFQTQLSPASLYFKVFRFDFADLSSLAKQVLSAQQTGRSFTPFAAVGSRRVDLLVLEEGRAAAEAHLVAGLAFEKEVLECIPLAHKQGALLAATFYGSRRVSLLRCASLTQVRRRAQLPRGSLALRGRSRQPGEPRDAQAGLVRPAPLLHPARRRLRGLQPREPRGAEALPLLDRDRRGTPG